MNDGSFHEVVLLRDSVSIQSLVRKDVSELDEFLDTEEGRLIRCVDGLVIEIPLVEVNLKSTYTNGVALLRVIDHLPAVIDFLIVNDLDPNSTISSVNVITRSQTKKLQQVVSNNVSDNTMICNDKVLNMLMMMF